MTNQEMIDLTAKNYGVKSDDVVIKEILMNDNIAGASWSADVHDKWVVCSYIDFNLVGRTLYCSK